LAARFVKSLRRLILPLLLLQRLQAPYQPAARIELVGIEVAIEQARYAAS